MRGRGAEEKKVICIRFFPFIALLTFHGNGFFFCSFFSRFHPPSRSCMVEQSKLSNRSSMRGRSGIAIISHSKEQPREKEKVKNSLVWRSKKSPVISPNLFIPRVRAAQQQRQWSWWAASWGGFLVENWRSFHIFTNFGCLTLKSKRF